MVARRGKIVHRSVQGLENIAGGEPLAFDTIFRIFSMTKPVTAVVMMVLYERGLWSPDDPIAKQLRLFSDVRGPNGKAPDHPPTMRELMTQTAMSGLQLTLQHRPQKRPDFLALLYGPMQAAAAPASAPPLFVALASDDPLFGQSDFGLIRSWQEARRSVEFRFSEKGGHGFGLGKADTTSQAWKGAFIEWLSHQFS